MTTPHDKALSAAAHEITGYIGGTCCHRTGGLKDDPTCECRQIAEAAISAYLSSIGGIVCAREPAEHQRLVPGFGWQRVNDEDLSHYSAKGMPRRTLHAPIPEAGNGGDGWNHDMDAAPKDKTPVIIAVLHKDNDAYFVGEAYFDPAHYGDGDWWWAGSSHGDYHGGPISEINYHGPSAWRPLPAPPSTPSHEGREKA